MMKEIYKHPQVIKDLIEIAAYIAIENLDASDRFLKAAEETFKQFTNTQLVDIRQQAIKGFRKYMIFYSIVRLEPV